MLFEVDETSGQLKPHLSNWRPKELELERYLITLADDEVPVLSNRVFGEELLLISNQVATRRSKRADLLALDKHGNGVIVELKRDEGRLGVETQALQYLSDFSQYRGADFIRKFSKNRHDLEKVVRGFLGDDVELDNVNKSSRVILIARHFDETLFSMGEWLSEKGVSFRCISYWPVEIGGKRLLSFSIAFDRSETAVYQLNFAASAREPAVFWHNIAKADQKWWEFLLAHGQLPACFDNSPDDQGAKIMSRYIAGDRIVGYAKGHGAVGWGVIEQPSSYRIVAAGSSDDFLGGNCRHRISITWKAVAKSLSEGVPAEVVRTEFGIHHPISTSVSIDPVSADRLIVHMSKRFGV